MADYYDLFSAGIPYETEEEKDWLLRNLKWDPKDPKADKDFAAAVEERGGELDGWASFEFNPIENDQYRAIHVYDGYGCLPDELLIFVQHYLKKFRPEEAWAVRWVSACSSKRIDGFSGGAAFVTAEAYEIHTVNDWICEQANEFQGVVHGNI